MKQTIIFVLLLFVTLLTNPYHAVSADKIFKLQLVWHHQFQFAGYYMALEKGFYKESGLKVEILPYKQKSTPSKEVFEGRADFGISTSGVLLEYYRGAPVVAVAAYFQHSPLVFLSRKDSGIKNINDLVGKKIMMFEDVHSLELLALLQKFNLTNKIEKLETSFNIDDLISGNTDVFNAYLSNEPYLLEAKGIKTSVIDPNKFGINFYGDVLFTSKKIADNYHKEVQNFKEATNKGWEYAFAYPEETINLIINKYNVNKSKSHLRYEANIIRQLVEPNLVEPGYMSKKRWLQIASYLKSIGIIKEIGSIDNFIFKQGSKIAFVKIIPYAFVTLFIIMVLIIWRYQTLYKSNLIILEKEKQLVQQSKNAAMGEMLGAMAHQLKQPLTGVSLSLQEIMTDSNNRKLIESETEYSLKVIDHMASTIDDFRNFFKEDKEKDYFNIPDAVISTMKLTTGFLKHNYIEFELYCKCSQDFYLYTPESSEICSKKCDAYALGAPSELKQVILNIIQNARESLEETRQADKKILLEMRKIGHLFIITIKDNGKGIPENSIDNIFNAKFTSKEYGTGLGLYMSKMIIEDKFQGEIKAVKSDDGAVFQISIPCTDISPFK